MRLAEPEEDADDWGPELVRAFKLMTAEEDDVRGAVSTFKPGARRELDFFSVDGVGVVNDSVERVEALLVPWTLSSLSLSLELLENTAVRRRMMVVEY